MVGNDPQCARVCEMRNCLSIRPYVIMRDTNLARSADPSEPIYTWVCFASAHWPHSLLQCKCDVVTEPGILIHHQHTRSSLPASIFLTSGICLVVFCSAVPRNVPCLRATRNGDNRGSAAASCPFPRKEAKLAHQYTDIDLQKELLSPRALRPASAGFGLWSRSHSFG